MFLKCKPGGRLHPGAAGRAEISSCTLQQQNTNPEGTEQPALWAGVQAYAAGANRLTIAIPQAENNPGL